MTGSAHACIGAGIGSLFCSRGGAFLAGIASHAVADALPHRDMSPAIDLPVLTGILAGLALWKGTDSPQFWGALGAVAPDLEHALVVAGVLRPEDEVFPTHSEWGKHHGPDSAERTSQVIAAIAGLLLVRRA